jgi:integrase
MASIQHRPGRPKPWRVRYRDPQGANRSQSFARKADARAFAASVETDMLRGHYLDPRGSKVRFDEFAEGWAASLTVDAKTAEGIASRLRAHLLPAFGDLELRHIKPSTVQGWLGGLARTREPSYVRLLLGTLSTILGAAVEDGLLPSNPCRTRSVKAPALPDRHRALVPVGAGLGLRQGEAFGLGADMIDFLRREVEVRRQVKWLSGRGLVSAPPKRGKTRTVPMPEVVAVALAEHIRQFPPVEVTLPWTGKGGGDVTVPLVFTNTAGGPINRGSWNDRVRKPALRAAGLEATRDEGCHMLRHVYASTLLSDGVSVAAVASWLGHSDGGALLLRTYAHVMPSDAERGRAVLDSALGGRQSRAEAATR